MKKITLLIALCFSSSVMFSQVVLEEDFETGLTLPAGWTNNDIAGNGEDWQFETGGEAPQFAAPNTLIYDPGGCAGNYAQLDSDGYGNNGTAENAALESPVFDCTGLTEIFLEYNHLFTGNFGGSAFVETSIDGTNWTTVQTFTGDGSEFGLERIDVSAQLSGQATSQVRFRWTGDFSLNWSFDNVVVSQCTETTVAACTDFVTPVDTEMSAPTTDDGNGTRRVELTWDSVPGAISYDLSFNGTVLGNFTGTTIGITGVEYDTAYTWSITPINCFGAATGCPTWNFTTEPNPAVLSLDEVVEEKFSIYPNPTESSLNIRGTQEVTNISIFNLLGQNIATFRSSQIVNNAIDISNLVEGVYLVQISSNNSTETIRVVKK